MTELTKLLVEDGDCERALRADFSNDRHYRVVIDNPGRSDQVALALHDLAILIASDPHLTP